MEDIKPTREKLLDRLSEHSPLQRCVLCLSIDTQNLFMKLENRENAVLFKQITKLLQVLRSYFLHFTNTKILSFYIQLPFGYHQIYLCQPCLNGFDQKMKFERMVQTANSIWNLVQPTESTATGSVAPTVDITSAILQLKEEILTPTEMSESYCNTSVIGFDARIDSVFIPEPEPFNLMNVENAQRSETSMIDTDNSAVLLVKEESLTPLEFPTEQTSEYYFVITEPEPFNPANVETSAVLLAKEQSLTPAEISPVPMSVDTVFIAEPAPNVENVEQSETSTNEVDTAETKDNVLSRPVLRYSTRLSLKRMSRGSKETLPSTNRDRKNIKKNSI